jgi:hypothetical protein
MTDAPDPAEDAGGDPPAPRDLSGVEGIDEMLARYRRAGDVMAAAKQYRKQTRAKILEALGGSFEGFTSAWTLYIRRRHQRAYTVEEHDQTSLYVEPIEREEGESGGGR